MDESKGNTCEPTIQKDPNAFDEKCFGPRKALKEIGDQVKAMMKHPVFNGEQCTPDQHSEMKANVMIAYLHIEYARMRLGKAVQAYDGGRVVTRGDSCRPT